MPRAALRERICRRQSADRGELGRVGDGTEHTLDVARVVESAEEPGYLLRAYGREVVDRLFDVENCDDLIDGENAEAQERAQDRAQDRESTVGNPGMLRPFAVSK